MNAKTSRAPQLLPHDLAIERAVLGSLLADNRALALMPSVYDASFYQPLHAKVFTLAQRMIDGGAVADGVVLRHHFERHSDLEIFEGDLCKSFPDYVADLADHAVDRNTLKSYVTALNDLATRRAMATIAEDLLSAAMEAPNERNPEIDIEETEARLYRLKRQGIGTKEFVSAHDAVNAAIDDIEAAHVRGTGLAGMSTGIAALDEAMGGLVDSNLIVLGGRPSMGKTALAQTIGYNVATSDEPVPVGFISLEMSSPEIGTRIIAEETGIPGWALRKGDLRSEEQWRALNDVRLRTAAVPFFIDESSNLDIGQIMNRARRMTSQFGLGLLIVDYIGLVKGSKHNRGNRVQEVAEITGSLKSLAKELGLPIIALTQLNRDVEKRDNRRPIPSDIRDSGAVEQDADTILFVHREEFYLARERPDEANQAAMIAWEDKMRSAAGKAEVILSKNRHGPPGTIVELTFDPDLIRFS